MIVSLVVSAVVFGCLAYLAIEGADWLFAQVDKKSKATPETTSLMRALLPVANGMVGAMLASYSADWLTFVTIGITCSALAMASWSEVAYGLVPDVVLVVPLMLLCGVAILGQQWGQIIGSLLLASPFLLLMITSKGKGVARTDIELAAVGGAMLGFKFGVLAFIAALVAAFFINYRSRGEKKPIELTSYMAASIVVALLVRLVLPTEVS